MIADAPRPRLLTAAHTIGALTGFAANSLLTRAAVGRDLIDAVSFSSVRLLAGAVTLVLLARLVARHEAPDDAHNPWLGAAALGGYAYAFAFAYERIDAGVGALLLFGSVQPTMMGWGIWRGERPRPAEWLGLAAAAAGAVVLVRPGLAAPDPFGAALMAFAGVVLGRLLAPRAATPARRCRARSANFTCAAIAGLAVAAALAGRAATGSGVALAVVSGAGGLGSWLHAWYSALPALSRFRAALVQLSVPAVTAVAAWPLLGEPITARLLVVGGAHPRRNSRRLHRPSREASQEQGVL